MSVDISQPIEADFATAADAMDRWINGASSGNWSHLISLLDPSVVFHVPVAEFPGIQHGVDAATRFFDHLSAVLRATLRVTATLASRDQTAFEVSVTGTFHGSAFTQKLCLVFEVRDGLVSAFREYLAFPGGS